VYAHPVVRWIIGPLGFVGVFAYLYGLGNCATPAILATLMWITFTVE